jgi:hypothetical protein
MTITLDNCDIFRGECSDTAINNDGGNMVIIDLDVTECNMSVRSHLVEMIAETND